MSDNLREHSGKITRTVTTSETTTQELDVSDFCGGFVTVSAGITTLTLYTGHETGDTFLPYYDKYNSAVTLTVASTKATQLPAEIYDLAFIKFVANVDGTIIITLKS